MVAARASVVDAAAVAVVMLGSVMAGCTDVPASPTYVDDVRPILLANCVRCHRAPAACTPFERRGYRLDHWSDVGDVRGVATMTERITVRAADLGDMPPDNPLPEREREILRRWQRAGSPRGDESARVPALVLTSPVPDVEPADQQLRLDYEVRDPDGDALSWTIAWRREDVLGALTGPLAAGRGRVVVDVGVLTSGTYQLVARLKDELAEQATEVDLGGPITIGARAAAPTVALAYPRGGERLARAAMIEVRWRTDDADSAGPLTARLRLIADDGTTTDIASGLDARVGHATWMPTDVAAGRYDLELTVSDGSAERSSRSACPVTLLP